MSERRHKVTLDHRGVRLADTLNLILVGFLLTVLIRSWQADVPLERAAGQLTREVVDGFIAGYREGSP